MDRMKTVLIELLTFAIICVFGAAAAGFLSMLYHSVASFVAGSELNLFSASLFVNGVVTVFPLLMLFVPMFLFLTLVRHPRYNKVFGAATIAVLSLAAWIFAVPFFYEASQDQSEFLTSQPTELSPGYFRNINENTCYFTFVSGNYVSGIRINGDYFLTKNPSNSIRILDSNYINFKRDKFGFSDPIIGENLTPPLILQNFLGGVAIVQQKAAEASRAGTLQWLLFSSLMAALVAVGAIISASEWKLADAFYITFDTFVILTLNCFYFLGRFEPMADAIRSVGGIGIWLSQNFQFMMNCALVLFLCVVGTIKALVHAGKKRRRDE